jgi:4-amino-4-deoxy-L-arabinose transferase-like glycosyltransferase
MLGLGINTPAFIAQVIAFALLIALIVIAERARRRWLSRR